MNLEIANRLLALRREHGYSQEELAYKLGVSRQAVSKWGGRSPLQTRTTCSPWPGSTACPWTRCCSTPRRGRRPRPRRSRRRPRRTRTRRFCRRPGLGRRGGGGAEGPEAGAGQVEGGAAVAAHPGADGDSAQPDLLARHLGGLCRGGHGGFLITGFLLDNWHPGWMLFLTIPLYYVLIFRTLKMEFPQGGNSILHFTGG